MPPADTARVSSRPWWLVRGVVAVALMVITLSPARAQVVLPPNVGRLPGGRVVPGPGFDVALAALADGDYQTALDAASREYQGGIKAGAQRWIDSIAAATVVGECQFELGSYRDAVNRYEEAFVLATLHPDWLLAVQFPQQALRALPQAHTATWGRSERNTVAALIPDPMTIRQGGGDPQQVLQRGGVLAATADYPIRPQEIMRSLTIALYRHRALLGELARESAALDGVAKTLARRPALPNHYSQSWIDIALGIATWSQGKPEQAAPMLLRGLVIANQFDHPLTPWGLIVLGRITLDSDQPAKAAKFFEEATYVAADYGDTRALEEAFRLTFVAHMAAGSRDIPQSIRGGCDWAKGGPAVLRARLLAFEADGLVATGNPRAAAAVVKEIDGRLLRGDAGRGSLGAEAAYAEARVKYATGDIAAASGDRDRALAIARARSPELFQTLRVVELLSAGGNGIADRQAESLLSNLLAPPSARDFAADPLGTLARISTPRGDAFEAWVGVAGRRGNEAAIEATEAALRERWLASQPLGGRFTAVERLLAADPNTLDAPEAARRAAVLANHPELGKIIDRMTELRGSLATAMLAAAAKAELPDPEAVDDRPARTPVPGPPKEWAEYRKLAGRRAEIVAEISVGRDPTLIDFPPLTPGQEIRRRLAPRQLILSFHWSQAGLIGLLESQDRFAVWTVRQSAGLPKEIGQLAKSLCLFDPIAPVATKRMLETDWQAVAERIERMLFENSKVSLAEGIDELVIVPDGWLWYVPFELLPISSARPGEAGGDGQKLLRDVCRIRYCPTRSLAVMQFDRGSGTGPIAVHAGRMFRGDKPVVAAEVAARLATTLDRVVPLDVPAQGPPVSLVGSVVDTLAIIDELGGDGPIAARPLLPQQAGHSGMRFDDWLGSPLKRPGRILLPGLQTAMAGGLDKVPTNPGEDIFVAATDLLAAGAHTALVSRWRMGGRTCIDLVAEFMRDQELRAGTDASASASWQRAVDIVTAEPPDLEREPRLKGSADAILTDATHPLLWAGYMLVDCGGGTYEPAPPAAGPKGPAPRPPAGAPAAKPPAAAAAAPPGRPAGQGVR